MNDERVVAPVPRIARLEQIEITPERVGFRKVAAAMREVIDLMTATTPPLEVLDQAAEGLSRLAEIFREHPRRHGYEGFAEMANAGDALLRDPERLRHLTDELTATFDHSPFIGLANPLSPPVRLHVEDEQIKGEVTFGWAYEGPPACVHGGYIAAVFDELLGSAQSLSGEQGMTASLKVDYRKPTPLVTPIQLRGWLDRVEGRKIWCRATMSVDENVTAEAEGLFIAFNRDGFRSLLESRSDRLDD